MTSTWEQAASKGKPVVIGRRERWVRGEMTSAVSRIYANRDGEARGGGGWGNLQGVVALAVFVPLAVSDNVHEMGGAR